MAKAVRAMMGMPTYSSEQLRMWRVASMPSISGIWDVHEDEVEALAFEQLKHFQSVSGR